MIPTLSTSKFVVDEYDRDMSRYGLIHSNGCQSCYDPTPLGDTPEEIMENWPWSEELDEYFDLSKLLCPCARGQFRRLGFNQ